MIEAPEETMYNNVKPTTPHITTNPVRTNHAT